MSEMQKTIKEAVTLTGKGLHTGLEVTLTILPAEVNHGIRFQRVDLENKPIIEAIADYVTDTSRGTTLEKNGAKVSTIEHVMAAIVGCDIDNALVQLNAPETPIMDGSAKYFLKAIEAVGTIDQCAERLYFEIKEKTVWRDEKHNIEIVAYPDDHFSLNVMIDYNSKVLGNQYANMETMDIFKEEIAPCRTFVFFHELEFLFKNNLIKGGDLENAIVILEKEVPQDELDRIATLFSKPSVQRRPDGILNNLDLRFPNECARHKLLDMVGDLALVGHRIKGKFIAKRPGHHANTEFAKVLRKIMKRQFMRVPVPHYNCCTEPVMDINKIRKMLPHRPPFLLVDKIIQLDKEVVVGIKNVTMNEPFFVGHFPEEPVMPGVLIIEAMAQVGGILVLDQVPDPENYSTYFLKIDKVKFKKKVVPGDTIIIKMELMEPIRRGIAIMWAQAFVGDTIVTEGELSAQVVKSK
jgi:UDP-3-O-[3-hydroxymyristoyl] N-acetylglucosamine deacetylase/3-hydroxyacyl-[acyl-carrier-protein] dehydratase